MRHVGCARVGRIHPSLMVAIKGGAATCIADGAQVYVDARHDGATQGAEKIMSKPNVKKVEPAEAKDPKLQAVTDGGAAPAEDKPKRTGTPHWKLPPAKRAAVKIGRLIQRVIATE